VVRALDLGCGAARNAVPLARLGWEVTGTDLFLAHVARRRQRAEREQCGDRVRLVLAPMDRIPRAGTAASTSSSPTASGTSRGLRTSSGGRSAKPRAWPGRAPGLFVFTFSRHTLPPDTPPVPGEPFVFTEFSGQPQCFLTERQLVAEMGAAGFVPDAAVPPDRIQPSPAGKPAEDGRPVIYEAAFRRDGRQ
jgi:hypothetical protein